MATTAEEIKTETSKKASRMVENNLKALWNNVRLAASTAGKTLKEVPTDAEFESMTGELIDSPPDNKHFTLDGQTISLSEIDKNIDADTKNRLVGGSLNTLVPTREAINKSGDAIAKAVDDNTGFLSMILNFIQGFFNWMMNGFKGGLMDSVHAAAAEKIQNSVSKNLTNLRDSEVNTPNDMSGFMTATMIGKIGEDVNKTVIARANGTTVPDTLPPLASVKIGDIDDTLRFQTQAVMKDTINKGINAGYDEVETFKNAKTDKKQKAALDDIAEKVSAHLSTIIADPKYAYNGDDEHLKAVKGQPLANMNPTDRARVLGAEAKIVIGKAKADAKPSKDVLPVYDLAERVLPVGIEQQIGAMDNKIPWFIGAKNTSPIPEKPLTEADKKALQDVIGVSLKEKKDLLEKIARAPLQDSHYDAIAAALMPKMLEMSQNRVALRAKGAEAFDTAAAEFGDALMKNKAAINQNGVNFSDEALSVMANQTAVWFAKSQLEMPAVPPAFEQKLDADRKNIIAADIEGKLNDPKASELVTSLAGVKMNDQHTKAMASAIADPLGKYVGDPKLLSQPGEKIYAQVSDEIYASLTAHAKDINGLQKVPDRHQADAVYFDKHKLKAIADLTAIEFVKDRMGKENAPPMPAKDATTMKNVQSDVIRQLVEDTMNNNLSNENAKFSESLRGLDYENDHTLLVSLFTNNKLNAVPLVQETANVVASKVTLDKDFNNIQDPKQKSEALAEALAKDFWLHREDINISSYNSAMRIADGLSESIIKKLPGTGSIAVANLVNIDDGTNVAPPTTTTDATPSTGPTKSPERS